MDYSISSAQGEEGGGITILMRGRPIRISFALLGRLTQSGLQIQNVGIGYKRISIIKVIKYIED